MSGDRRRFSPHLVGGPVPCYAVLDGARDPRVFDMAVGSGAPYECLYAGNIPYELAEVAPYLVQLRPNDPLAFELLDACWGDSWGIFLHSRAPLEELRKHFRRFLRVMTEDGKKLVFRYYDPRVFRVYLPTCNAAELEAFFGPVDRYLVEDDDGAQLNVYGCDAGRLLTLARR